MLQGRVIKGEAGIRRSRYQEDVLINNHTAVRLQPLYFTHLSRLLPLHSVTQLCAFTRRRDSLLSVCSA